MQLCSENLKSLDNGNMSLEVAYKQRKELWDAILQRVNSLGVELEDIPEKLQQYNNRFFISLLSTFIHVLSAFILQIGMQLLAIFIFLLLVMIGYIFYN